MPTLLWLSGVSMPLPSLTDVANQILWPSSMDLCLFKHPPRFLSRDLGLPRHQLHELNSSHVLCLSRVRQPLWDCTAQIMQANLIKTLCKMYLFCCFYSFWEPWLIHWLIFFSIFVPKTQDFPFHHIFQYLILYFLNLSYLIGMW